MLVDFSAWSSTREANSEIFDGGIRELHVVKRAEADSPPPTTKNLIGTELFENSGRQKQESTKMKFQGPFTFPTSFPFLYLSISIYTQGWGAHTCAVSPEITSHNGTV